MSNGGCCTKALVVKVAKQVVSKGFEGKNKDKTTEFSAEGLLQGTETLNKQGRKEGRRKVGLRV